MGLISTLSSKGNFRLHSILILIFTLFWSISSFGQTNFNSEQAAAYNIDIAGNKDGGFSFADFDNDGDLDLLVNTDQNQAFLLRRDGATFTDVTNTLTNGLSSDAERCALWADLNNDGLPDFIRNTSAVGQGGINSNTGIEIRLQQPGTNIFGDGVGGTAPFVFNAGNVADGFNSEAIGVLDYDGDGDLDIFLDNHNFGVDILDNDGNGIFTHVTAKADSPSTYDVNDPSTWPLGLVQDATDGDYGSATDYDNDGFVDIIARKRDQVDFFRNVGGTFVDGVEIDQADNGAKGSVAFYDFDNDGDFDLFWTDNGDNAFYRNDVGTFTKLDQAVTGVPFDFNDPNGAGIEGLACGDLDNDGDIDMFLTGQNYYLFFNQLNSAGGANTGNPFEFVGGNVGDFGSNGNNGEGVSMVDIEPDGDLDVYVNVNAGNNQLFINDLENINGGVQSDNFLLFDIFEDRLSAGIPNGTTRYAHGATIRLVDCDGNVISGLREVNGGNGHGTQDTPRVHFGLPTDINTEIIAEVFYPTLNGERRVVRYEVDPSQIGQTTNIFTTSPSIAPNNPPIAQDDNFTIDVDDTISFDVLVDNGNGIDQDPDGNSITISTFTPISGGGTLTQNPDGTFTFDADPDFIGQATFQYTIGDNGSCQVLSEESTATVTITVEATPAIAIVKTGVFNDENNDTFAQVNETISYTFEVTNQGDVSLGTVTVTDPLLGGNIPGPDSGDTNGNGRLDLTETWIYTANYNITQADIDTGFRNNQATASGISPAPDNDTVTDLSDDNSPLEDDVTSTPLPQNGEIAVVKMGVFNDENNDLFAQENETITYTFTVTNPGNVNIDNVVLTDPLINGGAAIVGPDSGDTGNDGILGINETWIYTATYNITQDDVDAGNRNNQALVTGDDPQDVQIMDNSDDNSPLEDDETNTPLPNNPVIAVVKTGVYNDVNNNGIADTADTISYTFTVTNEGDVTLTGLELTDPIINGGAVITGPDSGDLDNDGNLDLTETWTYTATYTLTAQNISDSFVDNQATITAETPNGDPNDPNDDVTDVSDDNSPLEDDTTTTLLPGIAIVKAGDYDDTDNSGDATVGDLITYTFTVTNTGQTPLNNVEVTDTLINGGATIPGPDSGDTNNDNILQTTETWTYSATYAITAQNITDGGVTNQATATGQDDDGNNVSDNSDDDSPLENEPTVTQFPGIAIVKTGIYNDVNNNGIADTADTIDYTFTVTNTGQTPLSSVQVTDPLINGGAPIAGPDSGDTNTDNILETTETWIYTASYTLTQTNVNDLSVSNQATATGNDPDNNPVSDVSDDNSPLEDDTTVTPIPGITIVKSGLYEDSNNNNMVDVGDNINYTFTVDNIGNTPLNNVVVSDPLINGGATIPGPDSGDANNDGILQTTETWTYTASYPLTAQNITDGGVTNQATATGDDDNGTTVTDMSDDNSPLENDPTVTPIPNIAIIKDGVYEDTNGNGMADVGDNINYTFTVTNEGQSPLSNVTVTDPLLNGGAPIAGPDSGDANNNSILDLTETWTYTFSYALTAQNITDGFVDNQATATGQDPNGTDVNDLSDDDSVLENDVTNTPLPGIAIVKSGVYNDDNADGTPNVGDTISYTFTVTNTGNSPLSTVEVNDPLIDAANPIPGPDSGDTNNDGILQTTETWVYTATYAITAQNITDGDVTNQAVATGNDPDGVGVSDNSDDNSPLEGDPTVTNFPGIAIVKTGAFRDANASGGPDTADFIDYTFTVTNTGQTPLSTVTVTDPLLNGGAAIPGPDSGDTNNDNILQTTETWIYTFSYQLTAQNLADGSVDNQATASGFDPDNNEVTDISDDDSPLEDDITNTPIPSIAIIKDGVYEDTNANGMADVGDNINYTFTVTNEGQSPLSNVTVTDPLLNGGAPIAGPDSGDANNNSILDLTETWTYTFSYALTAQNVTDGFVDNQATATGQDPNGTDVSDLSDDDSVLENDVTNTPLPGIAIVKSGVYNDDNADGTPNVGDTINYTFTVTNTGNSPLSSVEVNDPLIDGTNPIPGPDSGDTNNDGILQTTETWVYTATYAITAQNITDGDVTNQAVATGNDPDGVGVSDNSDDNSPLEGDPTVTNFPGIAIVKTGAFRDANGNGGPDTADFIDYTFTVTNTGQTPLTTVTVTDPLLNGGAALPGPDSGDTNNDNILQTTETWIYTFSYQLTAQNLADGSVDNQATASGFDPDNNEVTDISDDDSPLEDDITNTPIPSIAIIKDGIYEDTNANGMADVGDNINYTFTVTNEGQSPLSNVTVTDPLLNGGAPIAGPDSGDANNNSILDLTETWVYTFSYTLTAQNITDGFVDNQATAAGQDPNGTDVSDLSDDDSVLENDVTNTPLPGIAIVKTGVYVDTNNDGAPNVGDMINYTFTVTNTGNSPLSTVEVNDPLIDGTNPIPGPDSGDTNNDGILQTTETWVYTATYAITAQNITDGGVTNQATATGNDPDGVGVSDDSDDNSPLEGDPTVTNFPGIAIVKTGAFRDANTNGGPDTADFIDYTFTVTNTGQTPLTTVTVTDPLLNGGAALPGPDSGDTNNDNILQTTETWIYTFSYQLTAQNLTDGSVDNQATASGFDPDNNEVTDISDDDSPLEDDITNTPIPSIAIIKDGIYEDTNANGMADVGDNINYTFTVTNEGQSPLSNVTVTDPLLNGGAPIAGPDSGDANNNSILDLTETWTYTFSYPLTAQNITDGFVDNQATAAGQDPNGTDVSDLSDDDSVLENEVTNTPLPGIAIVKTGIYNDVNNNNRADVGDTITYTFTVTNQGQSSLSNVMVTDPLINGGASIPGPDSGDINNDNILDLTETWVYSATYAITAQNVTDGNVSNQATATGTDPDGNDVDDLSDDDSELENDTTNTPLPNIAIVKTGNYEDSNNDNVVNTGDNINYRFTVTNQGQLPLMNVTVTDPLINGGAAIPGPDSGDTNNDGILDLDETWIYIAVYPITQPNINAGNVNNQATASGEDENGNTAEDLSDDNSPLEDDPTDTPLTQTPSIGLVKDGMYSDDNNDGIVNTGDTINYTFTVTNQGNTTLDNVVLTDPLINGGAPIPGPDSGDVGNDGILELTEVWIYTVSYTLTPQNIADLSVTNQALVTSDDPDDNNVQDTSDDNSPFEDDMTITPLPAIAIVKTGVYTDANNNNMADVGDTIAYTFTVTNTGNSPLSNVTVTDPLINGGAAIAGPDSGDTNNDGILQTSETWVYSAVYALTPANITSGTITNQATATGDDPDGTEVMDVSDDDSPLENDPTVTPLPGIAIVKTGVYSDDDASGDVSVGDSINYTFTVTNTGQSPLSNVEVTDPLINGGAAIAGPDSGDANNDGILDLTETWIYTASYAITAQNITDGSVSNQATATGEDENGTSTEDDSDDDSPLENDPTVTPFPGIAIVKTGVYEDTNNNAMVDTMDMINYTFTVTNTGDTPLNNVSVTDPLINGGAAIPGPDSGDTNNDGNLDTTETWVYTASYQLTQMNIDDRNVENQATAAGDDADGNTVTDVSDDDSPLENDITNTPLPSIAIVKVGDYVDTNNNNMVDVGDNINYTFTVTNTGNSPLSNVMVTDPMINGGAAIPGPDSGDTNNDNILDLTETWIYTASYALVEADITARSVMNQATATGEDENGTPTEDDSDDDSPFEDDPTVTNLPGISIVKTGVYNDTNNDMQVNVGDMIDYTFTVTNTGNVPLSNVTVTDPLIDGGAPIAGPDSGDANNDGILDLTETWIYTASLAITEANITDGFVTNQATATGDDPDGDPTSDMSDDDSPLENDPSVTPLPGIAIVKTGLYQDTNGNSTVDLGDNILYTFTVTNTGQQPLMNVTVTDPLIDSGNPIPGPDSGDANNDMVLDLDETWIYTALYPITQQNINDGNVMNQATATGTDENGNMDTDLSDDDSPLEDEPTDTPLDQTPSISIVKTGVYSDTNNDMQVNVGDMIDYTFTVTNTGNVPLSNVTVTDPLIDLGNPIPGPDSGDANNDGILDLTETWTYTASLAITAQNITDGFVTNQATATGDDPDGDPTSDMSDDDSPLENDPSVTPLPGIAIVKTGLYQDTNGNSTVDLGDNILYTFTVTNTGQQPLMNVTVTDPLIDSGNPIPGPDSGDANNDMVLDLNETWIYTALYPITQQNINDGNVMNQATATGTDENGNMDTDLSDDDSPLEDEPTDTPLDQTPSISIVKSGVYDDTNNDMQVNVGDMIDYTFTVTNTGNVPLSNVTVTDPLIDSGNPIPGPDSGDANNDGILDLTETWIYTASLAITEANITDGFVTNQATATGDDPDGDPTSDMSDDDSPLENDPSVTPLPGIAIVKTGLYQDTNGNSTVDLGDNILYTFTVTNTGQQPLMNVTVTDPLIDSGNPIPGPDSGDANNDMVLDLDETWIYTAAYAITAGNIADGSVTNQATATGTPVGGGDPTSDMSDDDDPLEDDPTVTPLGGIAIVKQGTYEDTDASGDVSVGDMINYVFTVTNQGMTPLENVTVTDPLIDGGVPIAGPDSGDANNDMVLDLDETWIYTAAYAITAGNIADGSVTNQATATGTPVGGGDPVSDMSDDDDPLENDPTVTPLGGIAIVKQGTYEDTDASGDVSVGDMINYVFTVTNQGMTPLENVTVTDPLIDGGAPIAGPDSGDANNDMVLDLDETWIYTAAYAITAGNIADGSVTNQATATGTPVGGGDPTSDMSDDDSPLENDPSVTPLPGIAIVKTGLYQDTNGNSTVDLGDNILYTFTVTNTGQQPLMNVTVTDPLIDSGNPIPGPDSGDANNDMVLDLNETWIYTALYPITQQNINDGNVMNQATATGTDENGNMDTDLSDDDSPLEDEPTDTPLDQTPSISIVKTGVYDDTNNDMQVNVGDMIDYTFTVTNTGNVPLSNVTVTDPLIDLGNPIPGPDSGDANNDGILDLTETWIYTASLAITEANITDGFVTNQATATGDDPDGDPTSDMSDDDSPLENDPSVTPLPGIAIVKTGLYQDTNGNSTVDLGDNILYTFTVTNTGQQPLMNVTVTDPLIDSGNPIPGPDSGDANNDMVLDLNETWIYTALYPITQQNINDGNVMNQATATGTDENGNMDTDLSDDDSPLEDDPTDTPLDQTPSISIVKTGVYNDANNDMQVNVGDMIDYTFTVTNTGNVPLSNVTVTDPLIDSGNPIPGPDSGDANNDGILDLTETWIYTASLAITEANITDGFVTNQATATGDDPDGDPTSDMSDDDSPLENDPSVTPLPGIAIVKTGLYQDTNGNSTVDLGDNILYTFTVTNTGQQPLMNVTVTDPLIDSGNPIPGPDSGDANNDMVLDLNETWIYTALYPITQQNINDGNVMNQATATGTDENGNMDTDLSDDDSPLEDDPTDTPLDQTPSISIVKTGVYNDTNNDMQVNVGDMIDYTFTVTNTGNVPLSNVTVTDPLIDSGNPIPGPDSGDANNDGILDLTETWIYTASLAITEANITDGFVTNQATATGDDPDGDPTSDMSDDDSPLENDPSVTPLPSIAIVKTGLYQDTNGNSTVDLGDNILYTFTVTNTGQQPLMNVTVTDPLIDSGNPIPGPDSGDANNDMVLDLDETWIYTALYPITQQNINDGNVMNQATATGTDENGNMDTDLSDDDSPLEDDPTDTPLDQTPSISIVKTGVYSDTNNDMQVNVGDMIDYTFTVTNTGNVPLSNVTVTDPLIDGGAPIAGPDSGDANNDGILDLTETWTYTASLAITEANITDGFVTNQATATGDDPDGDPTSDMSDDDSPLENDPSVTPLPIGAISIIKESILDDPNGDGFAEVGDIITYTFTVINTGNVPLSNIQITDPLPGLSAITFVDGDLNNDTILDLDEIWTYTATYSLTQDDINNGNVTNQAIVTGMTPNGETPTDSSDNNSPIEDDPTDTPIRQNGAIAVVKTAISGDSDNDGISEVGDVITYTFIVTNEGNVPLENIVLIDDLITQAGGSVDYVSGDENNDDILDLDESWTYTAMYTITQADIDAGEVVNQAIASGETPLQTVVDDDSDNDSPLEDEPTIVVFESPPCTLTRTDIKEGTSKVVTPNGDTFNEFFTIPNSADCDYTYGVMIFNRWGNKVFENREDYNDEWNGFSQNSFVGGDQLPSGTYYYVIEVKNTDFEPITGFIFLGTK